MRTFSLLLLCVVVIVVLVLTIPVAKDVAKRVESLPATATIPEYGSGVYRLPLVVGAYNRDQYAQALADFKTAHPGLFCAPIPEYIEILNCYDIAVPAQNVVVE